MNNDNIKVKGTITLELFDKQGNLKDKRYVENTVLNVGRELIIDLIQGSGTAADYIAIGEDNTAASASQTGLGAEVTRAQGTLSQPDAYTDRCVYNFASGVSTSGQIVEAGRVNAAAAGVFMGRQTFAQITKTETDSLQVTYDFTYAAG